MPITVSIVEDEKETRETLVALLSGKPELTFKSAFATGEAAIAGMPDNPPDVALIDIRLPKMNGIECLTKLKGLIPQLEVLMLTTYEESDLIFNSLRAGANGYILKNAPFPELVQAIEQVHAGGAPMSMHIARKVVDYFNETKPVNGAIQTLTKREYEVLTLLAKGYHYKEIGDLLGLSFSTVRTHLEHIYEKLHVQSRTEATVKFLEERGVHRNRFGA